MIKTYQFKTHCKSDSHSSKIANIIMLRLMIKQRWTFLRLQAKYSRLFNLVRRVVSTNIMQFNEFEYYFTCRRKDVHLCFIMSHSCCLYFPVVFHCDAVPLHFYENFQFLGTDQPKRGMAKGALSPAIFCDWCNQSPMYSSENWKNRSRVI